MFEKKENKTFDVSLFHVFTGQHWIHFTTFSKALANTSGNVSCQSQEIGYVPNPMLCSSGYKQQLVFLFHIQGEGFQRKKDPW